MSKNHRGKGIRDLFARGRGICPACGTTGIKLLYEQEADGKKLKFANFAKPPLNAAREASPLKPPNKRKKKS